MKTVRFLLHAVCLVLIAVGLSGALLASFVVSAMVIVWFHEGALQLTDQKMLGQAAKWFLGCCVVVVGAVWLRDKVVGKKGRDGSFRLVEVKSDLTETKLIQNICDLLLLLLLVLGLFPHLPGRVLSKTPMLAGWLMIYFLGMHTRIALHEIGHLVAARLLALELRKIQVGVGPLLWSRTFANGLRAEWRAWPQGGFLFATHSKTDRYRARQSLFVVAGPLADLIILGSAYLLIIHAFGGVGAAFTQVPFGMIAFVLFWWTALSAVGGLVPHKVWVDHHRLWTDGYWLLRLWRGSEAQIAELARSSDWRGHLDLLQSHSARTAKAPDAGEGELPAQLAAAAFHEQRTLLSSRLLRKPSFTFGPPA